MTAKLRRPSRCPICKGTTVHDWRPFCSKRCADIDLGKWASGAYAIPTNQRPDVPEETED
jgi:endogenous inhibitor of DNA gyrase (YacG/DUF329 family)